MKYVQINAYAGGWANSVVFKKHRELLERGNESYVFWARGEHEQDEHMVKIATYPEICLDAFRTRLDGKAGFHSRGITRRLLKRLDEIDPDVVHLHVLLGYYINVEMLFNWLAVHRCQVKWTLHDCWAFTGHCIHFTYARCDQWKTRCAQGSGCPQTKTYPKTYCAKSVGWNFEQKRRLFTMLPESRLQLIAPSQWLASLGWAELPVSLRCRRRPQFHRRRRVQALSERVQEGSRIGRLFRGSGGSPRSGPTVRGWTTSFALRISWTSDSRSFWWGLSKRQAKSVPERIVALPRTDSARRLAEIYTAADVLFNPTVEDNLPTVNLEAEACGTPVVTYDTGGCRETVRLSASRTVSSLDEAVEAFRALLDDSPMGFETRSQAQASGNEDER